MYWNNLGVMEILLPHGDSKTDPTSPNLHHSRDPLPRQRMRLSYSRPKHLSQRPETPQPHGDAVRLLLSRYSHMPARKGESC
jgi:hypothetical protein